MTGKIMWLLIAAANPPVAGPVNIDYFLKEFNMPLWHWFFRLGFGLALVVSLLVYFYYRRTITTSADFAHESND